MAAPPSSQNSAKPRGSPAASLGPGKGTTRCCRKRALKGFMEGSFEEGSFEKGGLEKGSFEDQEDTWEHGAFEEGWDDQVPPAKRGIVNKAVQAAFLTFITIQDEATPRRRVRARKRSRLDWKEHATFAVEAKEFRRTYRMEERSFHKLLNIVRPALQRNPEFAKLRTASGVIPAEIRLAIALRFCAGASYIDLRNAYGVSTTAAYACLHEVVDAILSKQSEIGPMEFPTTPEELSKLASDFQAKSDGDAFAGCIGCLDGLHVKTVAPSLFDVLNVIRYYSGSKSNYGLNVQAIATSNYRFLCMSCLTPGASNDWTAYLSSQMSDYVEKLPHGYYLLGDAAYPLSDRLLTPYPGKGLSPDYDSFNFHLSQLRIKVEQSFGILVARWGILWRPLRVAFNFRPKLIQALFHLHNFCIDEGSPEIRMEDESAASGNRRPATSGGVLPVMFATPPTTTRPKRRGEVELRRGIMLSLERVGQKRPKRNVDRNLPR